MRVLLVTSRFPLPPWRGNQVRMVQWLDALAGAELGLVAPMPARDDGGGEAALAARGVLPFLHRAGFVGGALGVVRAAVSGLPVQEGLYRTAPAVAALQRALIAASWDAVVIQMVRCGWAQDALARLAPDLPVLFDAIDAMGLHFERAAGFGPPPLRPLRRWEARRAARREAALAERAAVTTAVSGRDLAALRPPEGRGRVVAVAAAPPPVEQMPTDAPTVLLSGNLGYRPTVAGALAFARDVWPAVRRRLPAAHWVLAGARPHPAVRALAARPGIEVHGDVADLGPFLAAATVAIAPMASGSGVPMKVLEAWAAGLPVVAHPWAAAGLAGEGAGLLAAQTPADWVDAVVSLLSDPLRAAEVAAAGRRVWREHYHPDRVRAAIRAAVSATLDPHPT